MFVQAVKKRLVAGPHRGRLVQDDHVEARKIRTMVPKRFPDDSLQPVTADSKTTIFFGNGQTKPCFGRTVFSVKNRKHLVAATFCFFEDAAIGGRILKPALPSEAAFRHHAFCWNFFRWIRDRGLFSVSARAAPFLSHDDASIPGVPPASPFAL